MAPLAASAVAALLLLAAGAGAAEPAPHASSSSISSLFHARARQHCGNWQHEYAALHRRMGAGEQAPRVAVSVAVEAGLADRLIGTFTAFYYALLSGRRFEILSYGDLPPLDAALEPGRVDWRRQTPLGDAVLDPLKFTYKGLRGNTEPRAYGPEIDPSKFFPVYAINKDDVVDDLLLAGDVASKPAGGAAAETVVIATNRGRVFRLFDNPHHRAWLLDHGLQPELCIACSFHYLFKARPEVEAMFATAFTALSDPAPLKIGINVRAGDQVWRGVDATPWEVAEPYFDCAAQIEATRAIPGQAVIYYFMSDSVALRRQARERFGSKIVVDDQTVYDHPDCRSKDTSACTTDRQTAAVRHAVGQLLAFSLADFHVYTSESGFGRVGAWLSFGWHHHYAIGDGKRACGAGDYDDLRVDAGKWAGV